MSDTIVQSLFHNISIKKTTLISDIKIIILEKCSDASKYYRKIREVFWIEKLNNVKPSGLNTKSPMGILWPDY